MNVGGALIDGVALAAVVAYLVSLVKPFIERLPFAAVGSTTHDATIQMLNVLLNVALVLAIAAASGGLTVQAALPLALQALAQMAGAEALYTKLTRSGGSVNDQGASATSAKVVDTTAMVSPL